MFSKKNLFARKSAFFFFSFRESHGFPSAGGMVLLSQESRPYFSETKKTCFLCLFLSWELRFYFRERHGCAFTRVTAVPLRNEKKTRFLFFFLSRESRFCFRERYGCAFPRVTAVPLGNGKNAFSIFFPFARVMVLFPREAWVCFRESHGRASSETKKKCFLFFFSWEHQNDIFQCVDMRFSSK